MAVTRTEVHVPGLSASSSGVPELLVTLAVLYMGLHIHGSSVLLAFDFPVLKTITNEICSLDEVELNCP